MFLNKKTNPHYNVKLRSKDDWLASKYFPIMRMTDWLTLTIIVMWRRNSWLDKQRRTENYVILWRKKLVTEMTIDSWWYLERFLIIVRRNCAIQKTAWSKIECRLSLKEVLVVALEKKLLNHVWHWTVMEDGDYDKHH